MLETTMACADGRHGTTERDYGAPYTYGEHCAGVMRHINGYLEQCPCDCHGRITIPNLLVRLMPEDGSYRGGGVIRIVEETTRAWHGNPIDNPACPVLEWPRYAWRIDIR